ncbi:MAG: YidC/Oxa1 family rane protein insertase [Patescibacteria group bacterium]|nr:YidC/Oxa1 family rane protein insertase [Patescibacteria group bacterium]
MWNSLIINPLTTILHTLVTYTGDIGITIVIFTILVKTILLPLNISSNRTSKNLKKIQPHIEDLRKKHKNDNRTLGLELSKLYKEHKIKPLSGFLALFIQLPILIGLYTILIKEIKNISDHFTVLGFDVTSPSYWLAALSFITMFILMSISSKDMKVEEGASDFQKEFTKMMSLQMKYFMPTIILISSIFLPAGITLYFVVSNIFGIFQYYVIKKIVK